MEHMLAMRILIVEDEPDVRRFFARALSLIAPTVQVVEAVDGLDGLARFQSEAFDLILSDQQMPRMTGIELLRIVRASSSVPFLLITADRSVEIEALAAGVSELLSKPISIAALRNVIGRYLKI